MIIPFGVALAGQIQPDQLKDFVLINYDWFEDTSKVLFKIVEDVNLLDYEVTSDLELLYEGKQKKVLAYVFKMKSGKWTALVVVNCGSKLLGCTFGKEDDVHAIKVGVFNAAGVVDCHHFKYDTTSVSTTDSGIIALEMVRLICDECNEVHVFATEIEKALTTLKMPPKEETTVDKVIAKKGYEGVTTQDLKADDYNEKTLLLALGDQNWLPVVRKTLGSGRPIVLYIQSEPTFSGIPVEPYEEIKQSLRDKHISHHVFRVKRERLSRWDAFQAANILNDRLSKGKMPCVLGLDGKIKLSLSKRRQTLCDEFWETLRIKSEIIEKLKCCLSQITNRKSSPSFGLSDANLFVLFIEAVALQGLQISNKHRKKKIVENYLDKIGTNIIGVENWKVIKEIRNKCLFHRTFLQPLTPALIEGFITKDGQTVDNFFESTKNFLENTISNIEKLHSLAKYTDVRPESLDFNSPKIREWQAQDQKFDTEEAKSTLMDLFKSFMHRAYESEDGRQAQAFSLDEQLFQYTVNLIPLMANFFPEGCDESGASGRGGRDKLAHDLEELRDLRNNIVHGVFESPENRHRKLLSAICRLRVVFSKFYYSQELFKVFLKINDKNESWDSASNLLENTLNKLQLTFGREYCSSKEFLESERNFGYVVEEWVHLKVDDLLSYFEQHVDLILLLEYLQTQTAEFSFTADEKRELLEKCGKWLDKAKILGSDEKGALLDEINDPDIPELLRRQVVNRIRESESESTEPLLKYAAEGQQKRAQLHIRNTLLMIQQILRYYDVSNKELIRKFSNRFKSIRAGSDPVSERLRYIPVIAPLYATTTQEPDSAVPRTIAIELDLIVISLLEMCNDAFLRYKLEFTNITTIFQDESVLAYLVDEFLNHSAELDYIKQVLQHGPTFLYPLIVKLITSKCKFVDMERDSLLNISRQLFKNGSESNAKFLVELLNSKNEDLAKVVSADPDIRVSILETLCEELCRDRDQVKDSETHRQAMQLLLQHNMIPLLITLMNIFNSAALDDEAKSRILKRMVESVNEVCFEWYKSDQDKPAVIEHRRSILIHALKLVHDSQILDCTDPEILSARRTLAKFHKRLGDYHQALELCMQTHDSLSPLFARRPSGQDLEDKTTLKKYGAYLLNFSDIAYAHNLLEKHHQAFNWYSGLYCELTGEEGEINFTIERYQSLANSEVYQKLGSLSQKYLSVLRVVTDAMYEKNKIVLKAGDLQERLKALKNYLTVYAIRESELGAEHVDTTTALRDAQYTEYFIGYLYKKSQDFERAREYYESSLQKLASGKKITARRMGEFHPAVRKANEMESKTRQGLALCLNRIGKSTMLRQRGGGPAALQCFQAALDHYQQSYEIQLQEFGEENKFTRLVMKMIEDTQKLIANCRHRHEQI